MLASPSHREETSSKKVRNVKHKMILTSSVKKGRTKPDTLTGLHLKNQASVEITHAVHELSTCLFKTVVVFSRAERSWLSECLEVAIELKLSSTTNHTYILLVALAPAKTLLKKHNY